MGIYTQPTRRQALVLLAGTSVAPAWGQAAPGAGARALVTILEGDAPPAWVGSRGVRLREGLHLERETIVRTAADTRLLRLEWANGIVADLGPDTELMIEPPGLAPRGGAGPAVYLLRGWLKLSSLGTAPTSGLAAPGLQTAAHQGALVVFLQAEEAWLFAESGTVELTQRHLRPPTRLTLVSGASYARTGSAAGTLAARPTPAQMQRVPRGFRDTLPLRAERLRATASAPGTPDAAPPPSYTELRDWLLAEPALRRGFTRRFRDRSRDTAFRQALAERIRDHPDWEPILFPERFLPPASAPR